MLKTRDEDLPKMKKIRKPSLYQRTFTHDLHSVFAYYTLSLFLLILFYFTFSPSITENNEMIALWVWSTFFLSSINLTFFIVLMACSNKSLAAMHFAQNWAYLSFPRCLIYHHCWMLWVYHTIIHSIQHSEIIGTQSATEAPSKL